MLCPTNRSCATGLERCSGAQNDFVPTGLGCDRLRVGTERSVGHGPRTTYEMRTSACVAARPA